MLLSRFFKSQIKRNFKEFFAFLTIMSLWSQFFLILKKNFTLRRRQPVNNDNTDFFKHTNQFNIKLHLFQVTFGIEIIWPILILLIVALIRRASPPALKGPCN